MGGNVACMGQRNAYRIWVGKPEGKKPLGRPRRRQEDNIRMNLRDRMGAPEPVRALWRGDNTLSVSGN
jgi:hypothetical protein